MTWEQFIEKYGRQLQFMARKMRRQVDCPVAVDTDDVLQEMLFAAWRAIVRFDSSRGNMTPASYAVMAAKIDARRVLEVQRNAKNRSTRAESRYPIAASVAGIENLDVEQQSDQFAHVLFREALESVLESSVDDEFQTSVRRWMGSGFDTSVVENKQARAAIRSALEWVEAR